MTEILDRKMLSQRISGKLSEKRTERSIVILKRSTPYKFTFTPTGFIPASVGPPNLRIEHAANLVIRRHPKIAQLAPQSMQQVHN